MDETNRQTPAQIVAVFMSYLGDEVNAVAVEEYLQVVLRTEGKQFFTPVQVAKICHRWALKNNELTGVPVYRSLCTSLLRLYQAEAFCTLPNFKLNDFVRPFVQELFQSCPAGERDMLKDELPEVKKAFQKSIASEDTKKRMPEYEVQFSMDEKTQVTEGEWVRITTERFNRAMLRVKAAAAAAGASASERQAKIEESMPEIRNSFQNIINETVIKERLQELIWAGRDLFNRNEAVSANILLGFVAGVVDSRHDQFLEKDISSILALDQFNQELIEGYLGDPELKKLLKPLFSNVFETRPSNMLSRLVSENDAEKRKKLLSYLTVFEPEIFYDILRELLSKSYTKWYYTRNLVFLTTQIRPPGDIPVAKIIEALRLYVLPSSFPALVQECVAAHMHFQCASGLEWYTRVLRCDELSESMTLDRFYTPQEQDQFRETVAKGLGAFDFSDQPKALDTLFHAIREESSRGKKPGKFSAGVNQKAVAWLVQSLASSGSRHVVQTLREISAQSGVQAVKAAVASLLEGMQKQRNTSI